MSTHHFFNKKNLSIGLAVFLIIVFILGVSVWMFGFGFSMGGLSQESRSGETQKEEALVYEPPYSFSQSSGFGSYVQPSDSALREVLNPIQFDVLRREGTERPFFNEYFDNHDEGIYVDRISGEPLYSSKDKFDSGTGWPSFLKPIRPGFVTEHDDYKLIYRRTEIRSRWGDNHIGHILLDGPESNNFVRHCMNSAAMRFVPLEKMEEEGYDLELWTEN